MGEEAAAAPALTKRAAAAAALQLDGGSGSGAAKAGGPKAVADLEVLFRHDLVMLDEMRMALLFGQVAGWLASWGGVGSVAA